MGVLPPDARALTSLRQWANHATRRGKDEAPLDLEAAVRRWAALATASEAGALEPLAPAVMRAGTPAPPAVPENGTGPGDPVGAALTGLEARRVMQEAVAAVQAAQPAWTEADLIRHLGERLPAWVGAMSAPDAARLLPELARWALATEAVSLSAPEWPRAGLPAPRLGESVYVPHGASRYATGAQLAMEDRLLADAQETSAPRLDPAMAAQLLGADQDTHVMVPHGCSNRRSGSAATCMVALPRAMRERA